MEPKRSRRSYSADVVSTFTGSEPPAIPGVRRSFIDARGVRFHVTEAGPIDGRPVLEGVAAVVVDPPGRIDPDGV